MAAVSPDPTLSALSTITPPAELSSLNNGGLSDVCGYKLLGHVPTMVHAYTTSLLQLLAVAGASHLQSFRHVMTTPPAEMENATKKASVLEQLVGMHARLEQLLAMPQLTAFSESPDTPYCQTWSYSDMSASLVWCTDEPPTAQVIIFNQPVSVTADSSTLADGTASTVIVSNTLTEDVSAPTAATEKKSAGLSTPGIIALSVTFQKEKDKGGRIEENTYVYLIQMAKSHMR
ncbi:hypothetical protein FDECE_5974 [Fusarium decemcellulare]|nr:hypothetical protein FDECE_5974 [Fusarium decemcellulare]